MLRLLSSLSTLRLLQGIVTVVSVHPARRCTSPFGVVLVGSQRSVFLFPLCFLVGEKLCSFFRSMVLCYWILLDMLVAEREPTPCCHGAYSGTPKWAFWGERLAESL